MTAEAWPICQISKEAPIGSIKELHQALRISGAHIGALSG